LNEIPELFVDMARPCAHSEMVGGFEEAVLIVIARDDVVAVW
jgi:hypothetical protein